MKVPSHLRTGLAATLVALAVAGCSGGVGLAGDEQADTDGAVSKQERAQDDGGSGPEEVPLSDDSIPTVPSNGPIETIPQGDIQTPASRPPQTIPAGNGFGGKEPPSFPDFTFVVSGSQVSGGGCTGGQVQLYFQGGGEGGDLFFASPDAGGAFTVSVVVPPAATSLTGNCVAIGTGGQTHIGGTHTAPVG